MVIFKAIILGLLGYELIKLLRKKKEKPVDPTPTYVIVPTEQVGKIPELFDQRGPPPSYYPTIKQ